MMSGLIFAGIDPVKAIKYQIMVAFLLVSTASLSTIIACYFTYRQFFNLRPPFVVTQFKKKLFDAGCAASHPALWFMCRSTEYQYNNAYSWRRYFDASASPVPSAARISWNVLRV